MIRIALLLALAAGPAAADIVLASRTVRAQTILTPEDLTVGAGESSALLSHPDQAVGHETRVTLYAGRPIRPGDIGPPALIERNEIVTLAYENGGLRITTDARALDRAGAGDRLRVMNLSSRATVVAEVQADGSVKATGVMQ